MSEPTPLWTGDQVMAYTMTITNDPGKRALVRRVALELVHQYEAERAKDKQRIQELEAETARLREQLEDDHIAATIQLQALTIERDDARQRIQELEAGYEMRGKTIDAMAEDVDAMHAEIEQLRAELARLRELVQQ